MGLCFDVNRDHFSGGRGPTFQPRSKTGRVGRYLALPTNDSRQTIHLIDGVAMTEKRRGRTPRGYPDVLCSVTPPALGVDSHWLGSPTIHIANRVSSAFENRKARRCQRVGEPLSCFSRSLLLFLSWAPAGQLRRRLRAASRQEIQLQPGSRHFARLSPRSNSISSLLRLLYPMFPTAARPCGKFPMDSRTVRVTCRRLHRPPSRVETNSLPEAAAALSSYGKVLADTAEKYGSADNDDSARRSIVLNMTDDIQNQTAQLRDTYGPAPAAVSAAYHSTPACKGFPFNF